MNEHIKLLKEQAMEWVPNMADPDTKIRLLNAEKFAELILADVIAIIEDPKSYNRCVFTNFDVSQSQCVAVELIKEINQKFKDVK